jgi:hypothetical protein
VRVDNAGNRVLLDADESSRVAADLADEMVGVPPG